MNGRRARAKRRAALLAQAVTEGTASERQQLLFARQQARSAARLAFEAEIAQSRQRMERARAAAEMAYQRGFAKLAVKPEAIGS